VPGVIAAVLALVLAGPAMAQATDTDRAYPAAVLATEGLASYWRLDEASGATARDLKGSNDGAYRGGVSLGAAGGIVERNPGVSFDGRDGAVALDAAKFGTPQSVSVEAWVKLDTTGKMHVLATNSLSEFNDGFLLSVNGGRATFTVAQSFMQKASATGSTRMVAGSWYHVVGTFDRAAGRVRVHVDGALERETSFEGGVTYRAGRGMWLGQQHKAGYQSARFLQGTLDEPAFYSTALPAATIREHYEAGASRYRAAVLGTEGLASYWRLDEASGPTARDSNGSNDGTYGGGVTLGAEGALAGEANGAASFDGREGSIALDPAPFGTPESVSVETWVKLDTTGKMHVLATNSSSEFNDGFMLFVGSNDRPVFTVAESFTHKASATASTRMVEDSWYHVVGTFDHAAERVAVYVNGALEGEVSFTGEVAYSDDRGMLLGGQHKSFEQSVRFLHGSLDEPAFYAHALPVASVREHYRAGTFRLRWPAPALLEPETIELGTGPTTTVLDETRDYIVKLPATKKVGGTAIIGGRNVVIVGGHVTVPEDAETDWERRAIYIKDNAGTVHIEGVLIDSSGGSPSDAIAIAAPDSTVQVQNVRVEDLKGDESGWHADIIQPWGGVGELRVDRLTGSSSYQGLFLRPDLGSIGAIHLSNINLRQTPDGAGKLLWFTTGCDTAPSTLSEIYITSDAGNPLANLVWPTPWESECPATVTSEAASWPDLPIGGRVKSGDPPAGDFVPAGLAGSGY
jgi:hypothetical protein